MPTNPYDRPCAIGSVSFLLCPNWNQKQPLRRSNSLCPDRARRGGKGHLETAQVENKARESHLEHLLFPESVVTNVRGAAALLQHYHGYYRQAIRDALNRSSRKPFQCGGLRGYDQLVGIDLHLQERRMRHGPDPYLDQLHERVQSALRSAASQADQVRQTHAFLVQVEHYLAQVHCSGPKPGTAETNVSTSASETVRQELEKMFSNLLQSPKVCPLSQRLARRWHAMCKSWLPHILRCYDIPGLPRSNLDLESTFGTLRRSQRRISGRKETSPIRIFGPGTITLLALDDEQVLPLLQSVSPDTYWSQRHRQEECEEPHRWLTRLHRDPTRALSQVDEQFYQVVNAQTGAPSDIPDP